MMPSHLDSLASAFISKSGLAAEIATPVRADGWILALRVRDSLKYFVGCKAGRALFSFDMRQARLFADEDEICATVFDGVGIRDGFAGALTLAAPHCLRRS